MKKIGFILFLVGSFSNLWAQPENTGDKPKEYEIGGVEVTGNQFTDDNALISVSGLNIGTKITIPGDNTREAIKKLMRLRLFTDVQVVMTKKIGEIIFLEILVQERPRLSRHYYEGVPKGQHDDLNKVVDKVIVKGSIVDENMKNNAKEAIRKHYVEKGFYNCQVTAVEEADEVLPNTVRLGFNVEKGSKVKIQDIIINGNELIKDATLRRKMKKTKRLRWYSFFLPSKFLEKKYEEDKAKMLKFYNGIGYRDARILHDTTYLVQSGKHQRMVIEMDLNEGKPFYFGNIIIKGNSIYEEATLRRTLGILKGDVFDSELLSKRLNSDPNGRDISTLYMDNGYLFFRITPIETGITKDTINMELRISEGPQATIDKVVIKGNDRTHEHVIRRELRVHPGQKFSRSDVIRSQREIMALNYFNPETMGINTPVNPAKGTVDIEFQLEERPADQLELSAGWGGTGRGIIGTLGVSFNNFSLRNIGKKESWSPLPQGDGQRLSFRLNTSGNSYQSYNFSFTEPWLGGKKPNSFTLAGSYTRISNGRAPESSSYSRTGIFSATASLGTRLRWPDDYFVSSTAITLQRYLLSYAEGAIGGQGGINFYYVNEDGNTNLLPEGNYTGLALQQTIARNSIDDPIFPRSGSRLQLQATFTPPYSLFGKKDYASLDPSKKYKLLEYHKWNFRAEWYHTIVQKLVLKASVKMGFLGYYNKDVGTPPFERYELGGDGITNNQGWQGREIYALRGYDVSDVNAQAAQGGSAIFNKYSLELRYPLSLNPSSTIFVTGFFDGGNSWNRFKEYDPFDLKRSAGMGLRVFLPMFGTLGFDYGFGFDKKLSAGSKFTDYARFTIVLGFEPE